MNHRRSIAASVFLLAGLLVAFAWQQEGRVIPPAVQHDLAGRDNCMMCHKAGAMEPVPDAPETHAEYANEICLMCHAKDATVQTTAPPAIAHALEGRDNCLMCHTPGAMEPVPDAPADHEGRGNDLCGLCHSPAS
jgi:hypothetical protein